MRDDTDWFRRRGRTCLSPFELNGEGRGQAVVLRYAGCNLRCSLCYAWRYAWLPKTKGHQYGIQDSIVALNNLPTMAKTRIVWVRIQGGEPCLNYERILNTVEFARHALQVIHQEGLNYYEDTRAVVQTNGITFATLTDTQIDTIRDHLANSLSTLRKGRIAFELSFKSPNEQPTLKRQLAGYGVLLDRIIVPLWGQGVVNVAIYPIAGLGPSIDFHNTWLIPIDPPSLPQEIPLFHRSTWSMEFEDAIGRFFDSIVQNYTAYASFRGNPGAGNGTKMAVEELEPTLFQTSWISGYAGRYAEVDVQAAPISTLLRRMNKGPDAQWYALFRRHKRWLDVLDQIPMATDKTPLLGAVEEMRRHFYPSHPIGHYPHL